MDRVPGPLSKISNKHAASTNDSSFAITEKVMNVDQFGSGSEFHFNFGLGGVELVMLGSGWVSLSCQETGPKFNSGALN